MFNRDVVDQLLDNDRLAHARSAERAHFSAFGKRTDQIDDFDSGLENLRFCVLLHEIRRWAMNRIAFGEFYRPAVINRIPGNIKKPTEHTFAHWDRDRTTGIGHTHAALQTFS